MRDDIVATDRSEALSSHEMRALILAIAGLGVAGALAHAEPRSVENEALHHLDRGVAAYRAGDYAVAEHELHTAQALVPEKPNPYRWLALTESALGECQQALVDIESFLSRIPADDPRVAEMVQLREHCVVDLHAQHAPPPQAPPPPPPESTPITHRWWLWTAVGVVAVAAGVTTYAVVHDPGPSTLPAITCGTTGCAR